MKRIVYFDGVCNLCNGFVNILIKLDKKQTLFFAPLQGVTAQKSSLDFTQLPPSEQSIYYIDSNGILFHKSNAVIQILNDLFGMKFFIKTIKLIPLKLRDKMYEIVASNRYRVFGQKSTCRIPTKTERARFLD